jgi:hypothetical protein
LRAAGTLELSLKLSNVITEFLILLLKLGFCHIDHREKLSEVGEKGVVEKKGGLSIKGGYRSGENEKAGVVMESYQNCDGGAWDETRRSTTTRSKTLEAR